MEVKIGGIYRHFRGGFYFVKDIAYDHESNSTNIIVIYNACDENGISRRIYDKEEIIKQPFYRSYRDFTQGVYPDVKYKLMKPRFEFVKMRRDYEVNP